MTAKIDPALQRELDAGTPDIKAIIRATNDLDALEAALPSGMQVRHRYKLVTGLAVSASPKDLIAAARLPEVEAIDLDREVKTQ